MQEYSCISGYMLNVLGNIHIGTSNMHGKGHIKEATKWKQCFFTVPSQKRKCQHMLLISIA